MSRYQLASLSNVLIDQEVEPCRLLRRAGSHAAFWQSILSLERRKKNLQVPNVTRCGVMADVGVMDCEQELFVLRVEGIPCASAHTLRSFHIEILAF